MTSKRFEEVVEGITKIVKDTLVKKQSEYNLTDDRLDVFKKAAGRQMITTQQALLGYMDKHVGSIYDYVHENKDISRELLLEKIVDNINYLMLLYAVYEDEVYSKQIQSTQENK